MATGEGTPSLEQALAWVQQLRAEQPDSWRLAAVAEALRARVKPETRKYAIQSRSKPGQAHIVTVGPNGAECDAECDGYKYRAHCRHTDEALVRHDAYLRTL
jgi:hypothetical protein